MLKSVTFDEGAVAQLHPQKQAPPGLVRVACGLLNEHAYIIFSAEDFMSSCSTEQVRIHYLRRDERYPLCDPNWILFTDL